MSRTGIHFTHVIARSIFFTILITRFRIFILDFLNNLLVENLKKIWKVNLENPLEMLGT